VTRGAGPQQLVLDLPHRAASGREDFLVSSSNDVAVALIDAWPQWPHSAVVLTGPAGAGKSHLVEVWRERAGASIVSGQALCEPVLETAVSTGAIAVEDIDRGLGDERVLFHLLNLARETRLSLVVTSCVAPGDLDISLPDLRSRLRALSHAKIDAPDDTLIGALLVKLFADRQLAVAPSIVQLLITRMERSADCARRLVAAIDRLALERRRRITRELAVEALAEVEGAQKD
jgi:chromosomal replication initiation ATPase DnaA